MKHKMHKIAEHFSLSQARLANNCPLAWWHRYQWADGSFEVESNEAAEKGSLLDGMLNDWFNGCRDKDECAISTCEDDEVTRDFYAILDVHPVYDGIAQKEILISIEGVGLPVLGYADLVTDNSVWEHKRGGGWDEEWWQAAKRQVALYASALGKEWGGIVQVKDGKVHIEQFEISGDLVRSVHEEIRRGWEATQVVLATPGQYCAMCDYETICPESVFKGLG